MISLQQHGPGLTPIACARPDRSVGRRYLLNFAVSAVGGGLKRLQEYARWFNANGGAWFVIHPSCDELVRRFPHNVYFIVAQPKYQRLYADCNYLDGICRQVGAPDLYYAYGMPIYKRIGRVNWFHLSNVLALDSRQIPLPARQKLSVQYLGWRIRSNYRHADVISAESRFSLGLINAAEPDRLCLSVNGSDDEMTCLKCPSSHDMENVAVVVGTNRHKALDDSFRVFEMLRAGNGALKLVIIGDERNIQTSVRRQPGVLAMGVLDRGEVIRQLMRSKYYISTTLIENSYNAASEGVVFAGESYISDIGPHRELLADVPVEKVAVPNVSGRMLHVRRDCIGNLRLKSWDEVIGEMLNRVAVRPSEQPMNVSRRGD
jgi:hypothetical protein